MSDKNTVFYRQNAAVHVDFSAEEISSDGAVVLLEKLERKHKLLNSFSKHLPDYRDPLRTIHSMEKLLKQRVYMLMQGYEDTNDVFHLQNDPLFKDILDGDLASQPTLSRFENGIEKRTIFELCYACIDRYVSGLKGREEVIIDIDATDDPTHGAQQLSMFNGYYGQFMYNELFFHDGVSGQIILPVLRPGNSHSNRWYVGILSRIVKKIREKYPDIKIIIRADSGFSCPAFYSLAKKHNLLYAIGMASNDILKKKSTRAAKVVQLLYVDKKEKHQHFFSFPYQAGTWESEQMCHCKVESTGIGLNVRYIISNFEGESAREIYTEFYVKRGEASENRIKEVKNMCFSDRLSNHLFLANFFRLFLSYLAYEMFRLLKLAIAKTSFTEAKRWQIDTIRTRLLKIGATIKITKRRIYYRLSKAFVFQDLFKALVYT
jgi:hypothetical protein